MDSEKRKRSFDDFLENKSALADENLEARADTSAAESSTPAAESEWQMVTNASRKSRRSSKKQKNKKNGQSRESTRPSLTYSNLHKLTSFLKVADLQNLVLYCLADDTAPQWVSVSHHGQVRKAVILLVPGLERSMFGTNSILEERVGQPVRDPQCLRKEDWKPETGPDAFMPTHLADNILPEALKPLAEIFPHVWPVIAQGDSRFSKVYSPVHSMLTVSLSKSEKKNISNTTKDVAKSRSREEEVERTPIKTYIVSQENLVDNGFILHPAFLGLDESKEEYYSMRIASKTSAEFGWKDSNVNSLESLDEAEQSNEKDDTDTGGWKVLAMDCEMCRVEGDELALTRISVLDWNGRVILNEYVKPDRPVTDYLTQYSGVTAKHLEGVKTSLGDIQDRLLELLDQKTALLGHSLDSDLQALKITHPFILDTTIAYPHPRGPPLKSSLKWLAQKYLNREIQKSHGLKGHDSVEDAKACLDLMRQKFEKGPKWGTFEATGETIFKRLLRSPKIGSRTICGEREGKSAAIVDHAAAEKGTHTGARVYLPCKSDAEIVSGIRRAVLGDADGKTVPGGGVEFTWARLKELEDLRGWANARRFGPTGPEEPPSIDDKVLVEAVAQVTKHIAEIKAFLPPCTLFIVYSGMGDPRELVRLQEMQRTFQKEYAVKKWDQLSVQWTDTEEQALRKACRTARQGLALVCMA